MTLNYDCGNQERLVEYLYGDCEPEARLALESHLALCGHCSEEIGSLREARGTLAAWTPPAVALGFRITSEANMHAAMAAEVSPPAAVLRPARWWRQPLPAWAQAAAAVLIFGAGLGLGALRGVSAPADDRAAAAAVAPAAAADVSVQDLAALEQRLRAEMQQLRTSAAAPAGAAVTPAGTATGGVTLPQVRALIAESEQRQQRELTLRTAEVIRDFDTQRRGDLARIQQTFGRFEGTTSAEVEQQRQMLNYLMRVSQSTPQP